MSSGSIAQEQIREVNIRALKIAAIVGSILATINYGDKIVLSSMIQLDWIKLCATYLVPFFVSRYSGMQALAKKA